ncbi:hypothetical protein DP939_34505 [Spongiactinospora rosea]|uniref:Uncharacterized protein n=1 Tax=Spongiactinospora rosea TaxID=2248750 RepID=A0A366LQ90_9ACTN|nr:hypothetical protein [Spongiactinospora rosea]RBQ15494.1 hypothetical protein DP939_34505 [Spongiactinospora rosea]
MDLTASPRATTELQRGAEALLAHLAAGGATPVLPATFADVDGHWLPPAMEALVALMAGQDALHPLAKAAQRDERRTALFLCLALAVAGQGDRIHASWLGIAFGELSADRPVAHGQRALWVTAARGAYGPAGKIFVLRKLDAVDLPDQDDVDGWLAALIPGNPAVVIPHSLVDYPELAEIPGLADPTQAAAKLARLRGRCVEITSSKRPDDSASPPPRNGSGRPVSAWAHDEPLAVLRGLIGSGGPEGPMGSLVGHLRDDLSPGADPDLAAAALHVVAPIVRSVAEELTEATRSAPPTQITVPILGHDILLLPEGPDPRSLADAERRITESGVPKRRGPWPGYALAALGVVLGVAAFLVPMLLLLVPGVALCALAGHLLWRAHGQSRADDDYVRARTTELRELADGAVWAMHEYAREADNRAKLASDDLTELTRLIRRGPRAA